MRYRLAQGQPDYQLCKELLADEQFNDQEISFPTVMAIDDENEVVGFLATTPHEDMVLAGPLVMRHDMRRPRTAIQLIQLYETTMRGLGMKSFIFGADPRYGFVLEGIKRYFPDMQPYGYGPDGTPYYIWPLHKVAEEA